MVREAGVACVGAGYWGQNLVRTMADLGVLRAVCEVDAARRSEVARRYPAVHVTESMEEILADPAIGGVAVATPAVTHGALVRRCLLAGKDVLVEKPLCLSRPEGEELAALAAREGRILMVGHLLRYHPAVVRLQQLVREGALGRLRYIHASRHNLGRVRQEENVLWSFAPHDLSVILALVGALPEQVVAQGGRFLHRGVDDLCTMLMAFPGGIRVHLSVSWLHPFKEQRLVVAGDEQMAVFDDCAPQEKLVLYPHLLSRESVQKAEGTAVPLDREEPLRAECRHFLQRMADRTRPLTDGEEAVRVLTVLEAGQRSLEAGGRMESPQTGAFVHPSSCVDPDVRIGPGTMVWHFSHLMTGSRIGPRCRIGQNVVIGPHVSVGADVKIQNNVSVYQGVTLEDEVFCGPSVVFTNVHNPRSAIPRMDQLRPTTVRQGATLGANATVVCGVTIGRYAFIGAGAVVTRDVPDFALVVGNPGRVVGWVCRCGHRIAFGEAPEEAAVAAPGEASAVGHCTACLQRYRRNGQKLLPCVDL